jgi:hypothetical protein
MDFLRGVLGRIWGWHQGGPNRAGCGRLAMFGLPEGQKGPFDLQELEITFDRATGGHERAMRVAHPVAATRAPDDDLLGQQGMPLGLVAPSGRMRQRIR